MDDRELDLQPRQQRLLTRLVLAEGDWVSMDELAAWLWDDKEQKPQRKSHDALHRCAYGLRRELRSSPADDDPLPSDNGAYRIRMDRQQADIHRFHDLADEARKHARRDDEEAARLGREALRQWGDSRIARLRGPEPLAGLSGQQAEHIRDTLRAEHRDVLIGVLNAELRCRRHRDLIPELDALARADEAGRDDQELARLRMLAYSRSGRPGEAQRIYEETREWLTRHRGIEPNPELRVLYQRILDRDPDLLLPPGAAMTYTDIPVYDAESATQTPPASHSDAAETSSTSDASAATDSEEENESLRRQVGLDSSDPSEEPPPTRRAKQPNTTDTIHNEFHEVVDVRGGTIGISHHYGTGG